MDATEAAAPPSVTGRIQRLTWLRRAIPVVLLAAVYIAAWIVSPIATNQTLSDLDLFFWPAAQFALHGHVLQIYSIPGLDVYPDANGPIGLLPLLPGAAVANALGVANDLRVRAGLADAAVAIFALLMAQQALYLIQLARGRIEWRLAAPLVFLAAPALWIGVADFGHIEQPIELWLVLLAVRFALKRRLVVSGVLLGFAVLTRSTALLYVVPFAVMLLANGRFRAAVGLTGAAAGTALLGIAPFLVAAPGSVVHSLITYRGALRIAGGSLWLALLHTPIANLIQHGDTYVVVACVVALCALTAWRRPRSAASPAGLCGLLTIAALSFPMLAKTSFPYYLVEAYVLGAVWWLARPGSAWNWRIAVPLLITADVLLGKWAETLVPLSPPYVQEGIASSAVLAIVTMLVAWDLLSTKVGALRPTTVEANEASSSPPLRRAEPPAPSARPTAEPVRR